MTQEKSQIDKMMGENPQKISVIKKEMDTIKAQVNKLTDEYEERSKQVNNFSIQQRQSKGVTAIPLGLAVKKVFSALKRNEIVAVLGDIDYTNPDAGVKVKLFGQDTILPKGPAVFSLRAACPIVPGYMLRRKGNTFNFILGEPIVYEPSKDWEYDVTQLTEKIAKVMQDYIGESPEQWFMLFPRWKNNS